MHVSASAASGRASERRERRERRELNISHVVSHTAFHRIQQDVDIGERVRPPGADADRSDFYGAACSTARQP